MLSPCTSNIYWFAFVVVSSDGSSILAVSDGSVVLANAATSNGGVVSAKASSVMSVTGNSSVGYNGATNNGEEGDRTILSSEHKTNRQTPHDATF